MLWNKLDRHYDLGLLIIRLGFGLGFVWFHGLPKLMGGVERWAATGGAMESLGIGIGAQWWGLAAALFETAGGLLFALGLLFRPVALGLMVVMVVATVNHFATGEGSPAHSFKNVWLFAGLVLTGPGRYSIDALISDRVGGRGAASPRGPQPRSAALR